MNKVLCVFTKNSIELFGTLFDFLNYNNERYKINSLNISKASGDLHNTGETTIDVIEDGIEITLKLKYVDVAIGWENVGKEVNNKIEW